jgi:hypothetical protein
MYLLIRFKMFCTIILNASGMDHNGEEGDRQQTTDNRQKSGDCIVPSFGFQISAFGQSLAVVWELRTNTDNRIIDPIIPNIYAKIGLNIPECGPNGAGECSFPYRGRSQSGLSGPGLTVSITTLNRSKDTVVVQ